MRVLWVGCLVGGVGIAIAAAVVWTRRGMQRGSTAAEREMAVARDQYQHYHVIYASGEEAGTAGTEAAGRSRRIAEADGVVTPAGTRSET